MTTDEIPNDIRKDNFKPGSLRICDICKRVFQSDNEDICFICRGPDPKFEGKVKARNSSLFIKKYPDVK